MNFTLTFGEVAFLFICFSLAAYGSLVVHYSRKQHEHKER